MKYPLETYVLGGKKLGALDTILNTNPRSITHLFDPPDLLEEDDSPENDPYLESLQTEKGSGPCHLPFTLEIQSGSLFCSTQRCL